MASITLKVDELTLQKMKFFYQEDQFSTTNPYVEFAAKIEGCTITAYTSKKVLFQGEKATSEASIWQTIQIEHMPSTQDFYQISIGSDEVGTGDYFGPVVVVAAYLSPDKLDAIKQLQIDDSKKLTDEIILKVAPTLFQLLPYSLLIVNNEKYNQTMHSEMNLNKMKALLHKQAIEHLIHKLNFTPHIIIDQFCEKSLFNRYTNNTTFTEHIYFTTKAESKFASVAIASMMARYIFLQEFDKLSKTVQMTLQKGASSKVDEQGKVLIQKYGEEILFKVAKLHFKNTEKIKNEPHY